MSAEETQKPYLVKASGALMEKRGANFGWVPKHPVYKGHAFLGYKFGKVVAGQTFAWYGDPENPPKWAEPADEAARGVYAAVAEADKHGTSKDIAVLERKLEKLRAKAIKDAEELPEDVSERTSDGTPLRRRGRPPKTVSAGPKPLTAAETRSTLPPNADDPTSTIFTPN